MNTEPRPSDPQLVAALKATKLSGAEIGRAVGYSSSYISQYLNNKFPGDLDAVETAIREWLRDRTISISSGVPTIETEISSAMRRRFEETRSSCSLTLLTGPAGIGKSRGGSIYLRDHTLAICFRAIPWRTGMNAIAEDLSAAAGITRLARGEKRWDAILDRTRGSGRLLIVDDAHELAPRALQCCVDYHEETGNPVCLVGLPTLRKKLLTDARRARRVDEAYELRINNPGPLLEHLVTLFAPDANGERDRLICLCAQVAGGIGAFGSVEKQLKFAARSRKKKPGLAWIPAFQAAHQRLLRNYTLDSVSTH